MAAGFVGPEAQENVCVPFEWLSGERVIQGADDEGVSSVQRDSLHVKAARALVERPSCAENHGLGADRANRRRR